MTEKEKMIKGELYNSADEELVEDRKRAKRITREINTLTENDEVKRKKLFKELLGETGEDFTIESPFYCDYGYNICWGENAYANLGCIILDVAPVVIGSNVLLAPGVQLLTATHPLDVKTRNSGLEFAKPITIGDKVWIGGGVIVNPGVTIGKNSVIGSGSVVVKDIPENVLAAGNPCRIIKVISP